MVEDEFAKVEGAETKESADDNGVDKATEEREATAGAEAVTSLTEEDSSARKIVWPGQETWGPEDGTVGQNDRQIALRTALNTINAQEHPTNSQIQDRAERDNAYYGSLEGDAKRLVDQAIEDIKSKATGSSEASAAAELIDQAA